MPVHKIKQGECIDSIAQANGFHWRTLWQHSGNKALKDKRKDPFVLLDGDEVFIPELTQRLESCPTEARHSFRRLSVPSRFRLQVCVADEPLANQPFEALVDGDQPHVGTTDSAGWVEFPIAPGAIRGELWVGDPQGAAREYVLLEFGCLEPITETSGVQQRLSNLGFAVGEVGALDEDTRGAIAEFQESIDIEPTGEPDSRTRDRLIELHGS